jgi:hypothetical protein
MSRYLVLQKGNRKYFKKLHIDSLGQFLNYVTPRVSNLMEEEFCTLNEIYGIVILDPILC